ncbi:MAG: hypothetical protein WCI48_04195 [Bacteroidota bacterium]|jgi:hypothetical protein
MKNKAFLLVFFLLAGYPAVLKCQSYEGYIGDNIPVWFTLSAGTTDAVLYGTYFYKKNGDTISISGSMTGNTIILNEKNKDGLITGIFACMNFIDSITGNWKKPSGDKLLPVKLYKVNPSFKTCARIPAADKLILTQGNTLNNELKDYAGDSGKPPKLRYNFAEKCIVSTYFDWEYLGPYLSTGTIHHTFNLTSNKEIALLKEIDPAKLPQLKNKIKSRIQSALDSAKNNYSVQEWIDAFGDKKTYEDSFRVSEIKENAFDNYFIRNDFMYIKIDDYFAFPHVIQAMDLTISIVIPFAELGSYLNDSSILKNISKAGQ